MTAITTSLVGHKRPLSEDFPKKPLEDSPKKPQQLFLHDLSNSLLETISTFVSFDSLATSQSVCKRWTKHFRGVDVNEWDLNFLPYTEPVEKNQTLVKKINDKVIKNYLEGFRSTDLTRLDKINLSCTTITDDGLKAVKEASSLKGLDLSFTGITSLKNITTLSLQALSLRYCVYFNEDLITIQHMPLQELDLAKTNIKNITFLKEMTSLTSLDLSDCYGITNFKLLKNLIFLVELNVSRTNIKSEDFKGWDFKRLEVLNISYCLRVGDKGLKSIAHLPKHSLNTLDISGANRLSDRGKRLFKELGGSFKLIDKRVKIIEEEEPAPLTDEEEPVLPPQ